MYRGRDDIITILNKIYNKIKRINLETLFY